MDQQLAIYPALVDLARSMLGRGADLEEVLEALRERSPSIIQSMKVVRDVMGLPMNEAKDLVHHSRTWSDMRDEHSTFHEQAEAAMQAHPTQNPDGSLRVEIDLTRDTTAHPRQH